MDQDKSNKNKLMNDQDFDYYFKEHLENHEIKPDADNWKTINQWKYFPSFYSFSKNHLLKVAATLLLLIIASSLFFQYNLNFKNSPLSSSLAIEKKVINKDSPLVVENLNVQQDFVLDIESEEVDEDVRVEIIEKEIDEYLAFLLADEDEFATLIDSSKITKSLEPAEPLPLDDLFAHIPNLPKQEVYTILSPLETKIVLPHRFLKADEKIEDYLLIYENNQNKE